MSGLNNKFHSSIQDKLQNKSLSLSLLVSHRKVREEDKPQVEKGSMEMEETFLLGVHEIRLMHNFILS